MSKENIINAGETNEELLDIVGIEKKVKQPTTPQEVIAEKAGESVSKIDSEVDNQKELENEASGGEVVPGAEEIDSQRDIVKEVGKEEIKKVVNEKSENFEATEKVQKVEGINISEVGFEEWTNSLPNIHLDRSGIYPFIKPKYYSDGTNHYVVYDNEDGKKIAKKLNIINEGKQGTFVDISISDILNEGENKIGENHEKSESEIESKKETGEKEGAGELEITRETAEKVKFSEEVLEAIKELGLKQEELEQMETFANLSEGGQMLALKNYDQILVDDAIKMTPEKIAQIKQARKERYQAKLGQKKGAFIAGIRNFFGSGKRQDKAFNQAYEELKNQEDEGNKKLALAAAIKWVANFDIPAKLEDGKVKLEFIDGSKLGEEHQLLVDELNEAANKFARMPQYMSNISATKRHKAKYEEAQFDLDKKRYQLEQALNGMKSEEEIISILSSIDNKVSNLQNNLTDKEREEFEKSDSWLMKRLKSKWFERSSYLVGGGAARYMIRNKLTDDATNTAVSGLATYGTLGVAAVIGGLRGWQREKKRIREGDKKIGKQEYQETQEMINRKQALKELKDVTPEFLKLFKPRKDPQEGETWEEYQNRTITQWLKDDPDNAKIYLAKKGDFDKANEAFLKTQKKKFLEFKTEANFIYAKSASQKIEKLVNDIYKLQDQENISDEDKEKLNKKIEMLQARLDYTQNKIDDGLIALGTSQNRLTHSTKLFNTLAQANLLVETLEYENEDLPKQATDIIGNGFINDDGTINIKAWSESASLEDLALYRQIKIKNFLDSQGDKVSSERTKSKMKKSAIGAVSGAGFAFVGMKTMGYLMDTEAGHYVKEKIGDAISYGIDQGKNGIASVTSLFGGSEELVEAMPAVDEVDAVTRASEGIIYPPEGSPEFVGPIQPDGVEESIDTATKSFEELKESGTLSKVISNEGLGEDQSDSIWRSAKAIFTNNAETLGYEGDLDDAEAVSKWADNMTANAINRMDDVTDKVFEGNTISVDQNETGEYVLKLEQGEGFKAGNLSDEAAEEISRDRVEPMEAMPRRDIDSIPHTREVPNTETPDNKVTLDDLKGATEDPGGVSEPDSNQEALSDSVSSINKEGEIKSGVEDALDRARETVEQGVTDSSLTEEPEIPHTTPLESETPDTDVRLKEQVATEANQSATQEQTSEKIVRELSSKEKHWINQDARTIHRFIDSGISNNRMNPGNIEDYYKAIYPYGDETLSINDVFHKSTGLNLKDLKPQEQSDFIRIMSSTSSQKWRAVENFIQKIVLSKQG